MCSDSAAGTPTRGPLAAPSDHDRLDAGRVAHLQTTVAACPWLWDVLAVVRDVAAQAQLPCWVGAGAIRDTIWDAWYGPDAPVDPASLDGSHVKDIDVVFFDADRDTSNVESVLEAALTKRRPGVRWDATNQAGVHHWYARRFGFSVPPLRSLADGVASWPETATAVAVRRTGSATIDVVAPLGLGDLLGGVYRRNPTRVSVSEYQRRLARKRPARRWPGVRVLEPGAGALGSGRPTHEQRTGTDDEDAGCGGDGRG